MMSGAKPPVGGMTKPYTLVGFTGAAGSGKDTAAVPLLSNGYRRLSFADPLKAGLRAMFGLTREHTDGELKGFDVEPYGVSTRRMMQTLGTEWGRDLIHPDVWLLRAEETIKEWQAAGPLPGVVVTDVRFENEANWLRRQGGVLIHVRRSGAGTVAHASEAGVAPAEGDFTVNNDGSIAELHEHVAIALHRHEINGSRLPQPGTG